MSHASQPNAAPAVAPSSPPAPGRTWEITPLRFALVLAALVLLRHIDLVLGYGAFYARDFGCFGYPLAAYHRECFWRGEIPLWNPFNDCGLPFLAQWNTLTLYPFSAIYLLLPLTYGLGLFCLAHQFWAGLGMFFLVRQWANHPLAAAIAALTFAGNGLTTHCLMWPNNIAGLSWMPWVIFLAERAWRTGGRSVLWFALAAALQVFTGAPEIIIFTWLLLSGWWALALIQSLRPPSDLPPRRLLARFFSGGVLALGFTAVQWLPFLQLLRQSHRGLDFGDTAWSMPPWGWANFFLPAFMMKQGHFGVLAQPGQAWTSSYYLGLGALLLIVIALARAFQGNVGTDVRRPQDQPSPPQPPYADSCHAASARHLSLLTIFLTLIALFGLLMALGDATGVFGLVKKTVPTLSFLRFPIKFVVLTIFAGSVLTGLGAAKFLAALAAKPKATKRLFLLLASILALTLLDLVAFGRANALNWKTWDILVFNAGSRLVLLAGLGALFFLWQRPARPMLTAALPWLLLLLIWVDLQTHAPEQNPTAPAYIYDPGQAQAGLPSPRPEPGISRAMVHPAALAQLRFSSMADPAQFYLSRRVALFNNINLLESIPKVDGFYSLYPKPIADLVLGLYAATNTPSHALLDVLGVSHLSSPEKIFDWLPRPNSLPVISAGQQPIFVPADQTLPALLDPNFDPRRQVILPLEAKPLAPTDATSDARVGQITAQPAHWKFTVEAPQPTLVVLSQTYYPGWTAAIDAQPAPLLRANHAFQALPVPAGKHEVSLSYTDHAFRLGQLITLLTAALAVAFWLRSPQTKKSP